LDEVWAMALGKTKSASEMMRVFYRGEANAWDKQMNAKLKSSPRTWVDADDAPEITDGRIAAAELRGGEKGVRRGRPVGSTKTPTTVWLDNEVLEAFRATGPPWQSRLNAALADSLKTHSPGEPAV